jgi:Pumilio-family RNA binding repeat
LENASSPKLEKIKLIIELDTSDLSLVVGIASESCRDQALSRWIQVRLDLNDSKS